ncbi:glucosaminidase domain-containing protein [Burkholderia thailandensis]|nr:glucosaminidase domain-containing protein [Burkholderia thailandensis]MCS3394430.1 glucosaminidase domain-containing protein [Burkholderia thailandensis]MCS6427537.1 glucosaminidase domain-containing protein [Burkholderia thailandensis]MCS6455806.1 glucosaminidase domain-containing protein [Burkholderia thailandensis]MCS6485437.1 glucosaminidase domain-containing protein [Burkholderia thailandensis]MCS6491369.1 glucosaminidase domain-containing protein [Burkholderia thailandensis]
MCFTARAIPMFIPDFDGRPSDWARAASARPGVSSWGAARGEFHAEFSRLQRDIAATIAQGFDASGDGGRVRIQGPTPFAGADALVRLLDGDSAHAAPDKAAFLERILPYAREAGEALSVSGDLVAAHAALESGWGRRPLTTGDGANTHNLFGIKAGANWAGRVADVLTTEYVGGESIKTVERFRAYPDYRSAFADYAALLRGSSRFREVVGTGDDAAAFASALARGGYATDPAYSSKLQRIAADVAASRAAAGGVSGTRPALAERSARQSPDR